MYISEEEVAYWTASPVQPAPPLAPPGAFEGLVAVARAALDLVRYISCRQACICHFPLQ